MFLGDTPTLGLLIGLPIGLFIALLCFIATVIGFVSMRNANEYNRRTSFWIGTIGTICLLVTLAITGWAMWPWKHDYHYWVSKEGTVEKVAKRIVSTGKSSISQRYVVTIHGQPYGVDDTRAALVKPGDYIKLGCKREFEWGVPQEANGWACKWRGIVR